MSNNEILKPGVSIRPKLTMDEAKTLVKKLYGLQCKTISELDGYDDKNYRVTVEDSFGFDETTDYVLKILNSLDSKDVDFIEAQNKLLLHLCNNDVSCPNPTMTLNKKFYSIENLESGKHIVRLLKFIPGVVLHKVPNVPSDLITDIGTFVASLDKVLENFNHSAYMTHTSLWMLNSVPHLKKFIYAVDDKERQQMIKDIINEFEENVLTKIDSLEKGVIHGDFNEQNILVENINDEWRVKAVLDFGDSQYSCYLFELAITITYVIILTKDINVGGFVIRGYTKIRQIPEIELDLLKLCIEARLCQSLVMGAYSSKQDPNNSYILTSSKHGWELLHKLRSTHKEALLNTWRFLSSECHTM